MTYDLSLWKAPASLRDFSPALHGNILLSFEGPGCASMVALLCMVRTEQSGKGGDGSHNKTCAWKSHIWATERLNVSSNYLTAGVLSSFCLPFSSVDACMKSSSRTRSWHSVCLAVIIRRCVLAVSTGREGEELRSKYQSIHRDVLKWISSHHSKPRKAQKKKEEKKEKEREDFRLGRKNYIPTFSVMQTFCSESILTSRATHF